MGKYALFFVTLQFIIETNQTDNQTGISYSTPDAPTETTLMERIRPIGASLGISIQVIKKKIQ